MGRFLKKDTYRPDYKRPLSSNRYLYVEGDPINSFDPYGKARCNRYYSPSLDKYLWQCVDGNFTALQFKYKENALYALAEMNNMKADVNNNSKNYPIGSSLLSNLHNFLNNTVYILRARLNASPVNKVPPLHLNNDTNARILNTQLRTHYTYGMAVLPNKIYIARYCFIGNRISWNRCKQCLKCLLFHEAVHLSSGGLGNQEPTCI